MARQKGITKEGLIALQEKIEKLERELAHTKEDHEGYANKTNSNMQVLDQKSEKLVEIL